MFFELFFLATDLKDYKGFLFFSLADLADQADFK